LIEDLTFSFSSLGQNPHGRLSDFTSGVVLCSIVEKLEHMRSMEGVCRHDKIARATALHNIDKAFDVLRRKKVRCWAESFYIV
jgi:hypothetical protein